MDPTRRAMRAREIMQDPLVVEAMASLEKHYADSWAAAKTVDAREGYWHQLHALRAFQGHFETILAGEAMFRANHPEA